MTYGKFKDLPRRIDYYKFLCDKAFNIAKNPKDDRYLAGLAVVVYKILDNVWWCYQK